MAAMAKAGTVRPLPGSPAQRDGELYLVLPKLADQEPGLGTREWLARQRAALQAVRHDIESVLEAKKLVGQVRFEDALDIGALVIRSNSEVADQIRELESVDQVVADGLL